MAAARKKPKIQASDVVVGSRTLEGVLLDLAEQVKINAEQAKINDARSARAEEIAADAARRSARAEELAEVALQTIAALTRDLLALAQRTENRLETLEKAAAAE
jgi:hypothetical protein